MIFKMLMLAMFLAFCGWALIKLWFVIKRERNKHLQETVKSTIKADAAFERLDAAYQRTRKKDKSV